MTIQYRSANILKTRPPQTTPASILKLHSLTFRILLPNRITSGVSLPTKECHNGKPYAGSLWPSDKLRMGDRDLRTFACEWPKRSPTLLINSVALVPLDELAIAEAISRGIFNVESVISNVTSPNNVIIICLILAQTIVSRSSFRN